MRLGLDEKVDKKKRFSVIPGDLSRLKKKIPD
jgi:hypothetical protein